MVCKNCGKEVPSQRKCFCSYECYRETQRYNARKNKDVTRKKPTKVETKEKTERLIELAKEGKTQKEIIEMLCVSKSFVRNKKKQLGLQINIHIPSKEEKQQAIERKTKTIRKKYIDDADIRGDAFISKWIPEFEYISGYTNCFGTANIMCRVCGTIQTRYMGNIKKDNRISCLNCDKERRASEKEYRKEIEKEQLKKKKEKEKEEKRLLEEKKRIEMKRPKIKTCKYCGTLFETTNKTRERCFDCEKKITNKRRDKRIENKNYSINAMSLYKRDKGICYLCGTQCNIEDYVVSTGRDGRDVVICGDWYPSVDHVIPISKGGKDEWNNVRLAHRRCNTMKSNNIQMPPI